MSPPGRATPLSGVFPPAVGNRWITGHFCGWIVGHSASLWAKTDFRIGRYSRDPFFSLVSRGFSERWRCNDLDEISFSIAKIENLREEMKDFRCERVRTNISHRFLFDVVAFRDKKEKRIIIIRGIHFEEIFLTPRRKSSFFITE